jgi:hypothetical protein
MFPYYENTDEERTLSLEADVVAIAMMIVQLIVPAKCNIDIDFGVFESQMTTVNKVMAKHGHCFDQNEKRFIIGIVNFNHIDRKMKFLRFLAFKAMTRL